MILVLLGRGFGMPFQELFPQDPFQLRLLAPCGVEKIALQVLTADAE